MSGFSKTLNVIFFILFIIVEFINPTFYDKFWKPFIVSGILIFCIISSASAEFIETWMNMNVDEQRQVINEKQLNAIRPVVILETIQPESVLKTLVRQMEPMISIFVQHRT
ncbi:unnamed protein product [Rotaria sp. Silwood2]|nr:unnamed protein product [Rotaria sp. Silwood2]CAF2519183.1 unnamed protein product [Rotaria sp. Silwood2]CAF3860095.1 unnamed protein product [Rotaria sp. Silwood2]CAF3877817.1 unnamed protein product [Rotaria sp. Silwood2]